MPQIARSLIEISDEALDALVNTHQEALLRERQRAANARALRTEVHRNPYPKRCSGMRLTSVAAPGTDTAEVMGKTWFRHARVM